ncbi:MAG: hypothetical protein FJ098_06650 [Deltaproteobacteria bacterium]|nr:hypothetical protein [Deltaproteobacteria bacterium]
MLATLLTLLTLLPGPDGHPGPRPDAAWGRVHHVGLRLDFGRSRWAPGLGYMHAHELAWTHRRTGWLFWAGYGADGALVLPSGGTLDGGMGLVTGRVAVLHTVGGLGLELGAGLAGDRFGARGVAEAGIFVTLYYFDVGYSVQLPLGPFDRPPWMDLHRVGLRLRIPVARRP